MYVGCCRTVNLYQSMVATRRDRKDEALIISVFAVATLLLVNLWVVM